MNRIDWERASRFILIAMGASLLGALIHSVIAGTGFSIRPLNVVFGIVVAVIVVRRVTRPS